MPPAKDRENVAGRLASAKTYLDLAQIAAGDSQFSDPIVSLCVTSAIASADAVLAAHGVQRTATMRHDDAPGQLRRIGMDSMAARLTRLLKVKPKAQYASGGGCTLADASAALGNAERMFELAEAECDRSMKK